MVVGLGSIGRRHLQNLRQLRPQAEIAVLRRQGGSSPTPYEGCIQFSDLTEALEFAPSAALICGPATRHVQQASEFIRRGIPVLVEKPLAATQEDATAFARLVSEANGKAAVGYNLRYFPPLQDLRRLITSGAIGRVLSLRSEVGQFLPDWRAGVAYETSVSAQAALGGGVLLELSHELDYLLWILGRPQTVYCAGGRFGDLAIDVEDIVEMTLKFADPTLVASVHLDMVQRAPVRQCRCIGTEGTLVLDFIAGTLSLYTSTTGAWREVTRFTSDRNNMYLDQLRDFLDFAHGETRPYAFSTVADAGAVVSLVTAARRSLNAGDVAQVDYALV